MIPNVDTSAEGDTPRLLTTKRMATGAHTITLEEYRRRTANATRSHDSPHITLHQRSSHQG